MVLVHKRQMTIATAIAFSVLMAVVFAFFGCALDWYVWHRVGPASTDPDDTADLLFGVLVGVVAGLVGGGTLLWKFWPVRKRASEVAEFRTE